MPELIDNTQLFDQAHRITSTAAEFLERLEQDVRADTPEKEKTLWAIRTIIETQSQAIRNLVEQQAEICDRLNQFIIEHASNE